jgi:trimeric autotransporter adhesin
MKRLCALSVSVLALALAVGAGNAAADNGSATAPATTTAQDATAGQTATGSVVTVQVGSVNASPATAVNAPVNANAPVTVLGSSGDSTASQQSSGAQASSSSGDESNGGGDQKVSHSIGTVQIGDVDIAPATAVNAPVNANAPVCLFSHCGSSTATQQSGGAAAASTDGSSESSSQSDGNEDSTKTNTDTGGRYDQPSENADDENGGTYSCSPCAEQGSPGDDSEGSCSSETDEAGPPQSAGWSWLTLQVGDVDIAPATAINAPVNANTPVSLLSTSCGSSTATQASGGAVAGTAESEDDAAGTQTAKYSIGTIQVGSIDVAPATAVNAPINANSPVSALSCGSGDSVAAQQSGGATAWSSPA